MRRPHGAVVYAVAKLVVATACAHRKVAALAAVSGALAVCARPMDGLLLVGPLLLWLLWPVFPDQCLADQPADSAARSSSHHEDILPQG